MVPPTTFSPAPIPETPVAQEIGKCSNCAEYRARIQELEIQLAQGTKQKAVMIHCGSAVVSKDSEGYDAKDTKVHQLKPLLRDAPRLSEAHLNNKSSKKLQESIEKLNSEVLKDKEALRMELDRVKEVKTGRIGSNQDLVIQSESHVAENLALRSALEAANSKIHRLESQLHDAIFWLDTAPQAMIIKDGTAEKSIKSEPHESFAVCSQQSLMKNVKVEDTTEEIANLQTEVQVLSEQLRKAYKSNIFLKTARGKAHRILAEKLEHTNHQLHNVTQQNQQLVSKLEGVSYKLLNTEQERDYLRGHIGTISMLNERHGILLAQANRKTSENRKSGVTKLKNKLLEQLVLVEKLSTRNHQQAKKNKKLLSKNQQLREIIDEFTVAHNSTDAFVPLYKADAQTPEPSSPRTPGTPSTPQVPIDLPAVRELKRRSKESGCDVAKKMRR